MFVLIISVQSAVSLNQGSRSIYSAWLTLKINIDALLMNMRGS